MFFLLHLEGLRLSPSASTSTSLSSPSQAEISLNLFFLSCENAKREREEQESEIREDEGKHVDVVHARLSCATVVNKFHLILFFDKV